MVETADGMPKRATRARWLAIVLILAILASALTFVTLHLRKVIRQHIVQRDGIALYAASLTQDSALEADVASDPELQIILLEQKVMGASQSGNSNVIAFRVFDPDGRFKSAFPPDVRGRDLNDRELKALGQFKSVSLFDERADLSTVFSRLSQSQTAPLLRAVVPLQQNSVLNGAAEFILDGQDVARAFAELDRHLWRYSIVTLLIGGGAISGSLAWAFGRLQRVNTLLVQRTQSLLRANHELTLAAKTSALGAITAHLIHDLKSPLFGLQTFVSARGSSDEADWKTAIDTTERMQKMLRDIVAIMQEEKTATAYELSVQELLSILESKLTPRARETNVSFHVGGNVHRVLSNRDANIVLLIITNLAHNAMQATPSGGRIEVKAFVEGTDLLFHLSDSGPGLPPHILKTLFTPSHSTKSGGSGLGLAISKQLANHIGAELVLKETSKNGTTFQLRLPERAEANAGEVAVLS
jgi:signal transduction histidine kinase